MSTYILGVSAFYHDSAACLVTDGRIVAAAQEERFTRKKFDARFPTNAIQYCLQEGGISLNDLKYFVFYDKPLVKFERLLETYVAFSPKGIQSFLAAMPVWLKEKLLLKSVLQDELVALDGVKKPGLPPILFGEQHEFRNIGWRWDTCSVGSTLNLFLAGLRRYRDTHRLIRRWLGMDSMGQRLKPDLDA